VSLDPRTPVLVGAVAVIQQIDDPTNAVEAIELMAQAVDLAAQSSAQPGDLLASVGMIAVPEGAWSYPDPGALLAEMCGAPEATTVVADIGILQQDVIAEVCRQVGAGALDVGVVVGGEARFRALRARVLGLDASDTIQPEGTVPDEKRLPRSLGIHDLELTRNAVTPTTAYALIEHARMHRLGRSPEQHRAALGELYAGFAQVASNNTYAWDGTPYSAADIVTADDANRVISWPYTKRLCSQWNVDQAAALIICSVEAAERFGVPRDRWVFPWTSAICNHSEPVIQRDLIDASPGADLAARAALDLAVVGIDDVAHIDLYSCFPAAVEAYADALGLALDDDRGLTVTGGMSLAGGPLNNYVLQAMVQLVSRLRAEPGSIGLSSSVSGFLHKQGFGLWSSEPPPSGAFRSEDRSEAAAEVPMRPVAADHVGPATVATWTVDHQAGEPFRAVVVCDVTDRARTLATTGDHETCVAMSAGDWIGTAVDVRPDGSFTLA
jgi:acetyl-CoA C-acetyltransferase